MTTIQLLGYTPAQLCEGKDWFIFYYVPDPITGNPRRKRHKINTLGSTVTERRALARKLIGEYNKKLASGWNPFVEDRAPKAFHFLNEAATMYLAQCGKRLRPTSMVSYTSYVNSLLNWMQGRAKKQPVYVININRTTCSDYLNYLLIERQLGPTAYNSNLNGLKTFGHWLVRAGYLDANPWMAFKTMRKAEKKRVMIPGDIRAIIRAHFKEHNPMMYVMCLGAYHGLLRPKEMRFLQVKHVDLQNQIIHVPGNISKNGKARVSTMSGELREALGQYLYNNRGCSTNDYLFTSQLAPGKNRLGYNYINNVWREYRQSNGLPDTFHFYSLRDTGIFQMLMDGISPAEVMKQADHHDLSITTAYLQYKTPTGIESIKQKVKGF